MAKIYLKCSINCDGLRQRWNYVKLCYKSLTYNIIDTFAESAFEPIFCAVQFFLQWFGVVSITNCIIKFNT